MLLHFCSFETNPPASLDEGIAIQSVCVCVCMYVMGVVNIGCFEGSGVAPGLAGETPVPFRNAGRLFKKGPAFQKIFEGVSTGGQNTTTMHA